MWICVLLKRKSNPTPNSLSSFELSLLFFLSTPTMCWKSLQPALALLFLVSSLPSSLISGHLSNLFSELPWWSLRQSCILPPNGKEEGANHFYQRRKRLGVVITRPVCKKTDRTKRIFQSTSLLWSSNPAYGLLLVVLLSKLDRFLSQIRS